MLDVPDIVATSGKEPLLLEEILMRLACPSCDAHYEVPDDAIPSGGRDVQCSNCGKAWFQPSLAEVNAQAALAADLPQAVPAEMPVTAAEQAPSSAAFAAAFAEADDAAFEASAEDAALAAAVAATVAEAAQPEVTPEAEDEDDDEAARPVPPPPQRKLDASVLAVLREEAEREAEVRRIETQRLENQRAVSRQAEAEGQMQVQTELGMEAPPARRAEPALEAAPGLVADPAPRLAARRDLLPDVEEINSTLQPGENAGHLDDPNLQFATRQASSFRTGFMLALLILFLAFLVYVLAPRIAQLMPAVAPMLESYVSSVDQLRIGVNGLMDRATDAMRGASN